MSLLLKSLRPVVLRSRTPCSHRLLTVRFKSATTAASESSSSAASTDSVPVGMALLAAVVGVTTVSGAAAVVEHATASSVPPYDPNSQRFDQSNFSGRFARMLLACDPRLLLYSQEEVVRCQSLIQDYKNAPVDDRALWEARRICEAALHPDTGDVIPRPFRMSGYVPYNGPICVAMMASQSTLPLLFWAWVNQSQNALINYYNRNASSPMTNETLIKSYAAAVGSALAVAFGLATVIQKRFEPTKAKQLLRWVAFPSSVAASSLNCYIVRSPEMESGIPLLDKDGNNVLEGETSIEAARRGVYSTTASRALLQAPVYFVPPVLMSMGVIHTFLQKNPRALVPTTTFLLLTSFGVGLPATVAIFPQISELPAQDAEPKFQHLRDPSTHKPYPVFYYNKGL